MKGNDFGHENLAIPVPVKSRCVFVYLLECADGSYYCGVAVDVDDRFKKHVAGKGASYTRSHPPVQILGRREYASMSLALKAEFAIKKLKKSQKLAHFKDQEAPVRHSI